MVPITDVQDEGGAMGDGGDVGAPRQPLRQFLGHGAVANTG